MIWVLLIYSYSYGYNHSISIMEFSSKKSCEAAREKMITYDHSFFRESLDAERTQCMEFKK